MRREALAADETSGQDHNGDRQYQFPHETSLFRPGVETVLIPEIALLQKA